MKKSNFLWIVGCALLFISCTDYIYVPNHQPVNLFEKKNELILSTSRSFYGGLGAELGYSFTNHIGINSSFNSFDISYRGDDNKKLFNDYSWQNELVLFNKATNGLYLGLNIGYGNAYYNANNPYYKVNMQQRYLIPSAGYYFTPKFSMFLSTRCSRADYQLLPQMALESDYDKEMFDKYFSINRIDNSKKYLYEPALTFNYSLQDIRLQAQMICLSKAPEKMIPINCVVSASVDLCKLYRNWKK